MKLYISLTFMLFVFLLQGRSLLAMDHSNKQAEETFTKLLSLKFSYDGQTLADKIEEIKDERTYKSISTQSLYQALDRQKLIDKPSSQKVVTVYVPSQLIGENCKSYIVAAAYYPRELDPQELLFSQICPLEHVHLQLAYSLHYDHPLAASKLEEITDCYYLPPTHKLYQVLRQKKNIKENFDAYLMPVDIQATPYNFDKIDLDSKSKEEKVQYFNYLTSIIEEGYRK